MAIRDMSHHLGTNSLVGGGRKTPSQQTKTIPAQKKGQKPITFKEGGLHQSTGTKPGEKIPASKHAAAKAGKLGAKAQKQEMFYENVLKKGKK